MTCTKCDKRRREQGLTQLVGRPCDIYVTGLNTTTSAEHAVIAILQTCTTGRNNMQFERADLIARVENDLTLHPPVAPYIGEGMDALRAKAKEFAYEVIDKGCVPSREVSVALTKIEEALFYAIASIARYQPSVEENNA